MGERTINIIEVFRSPLYTPAYVAPARGFFEIAERVVRALYRAQQWLAKATEAEVAACIASFLPEIQTDRLQAIIRRYQRQGTWAKDPFLAREPFERLRDILRSGGLIAGQPSYDLLVDMRFARKAIGRG